MKQVYKKRKKRKEKRKELLTDLHCHSPPVCATRRHTQRLRNIHYTQAEKYINFYFFFAQFFLVGF